MKKIIVAALMALLLIPAAGAQDTLAVKINKKNLVTKITHFIQMLNLKADDSFKSAGL